MRSRVCSSFTLVAVKKANDDDELMGLVPGKAGPSMMRGRRLRGAAEWASLCREGGLRVESL